MEIQSSVLNSERYVFYENLKFPKIGRWEYHKGKMKKKKI